MLQGIFQKSRRLQAGGDVLRGFVLRPWRVPPPQRQISPPPPLSLGLCIQGGRWPLSPMPSRQRCRFLQTQLDQIASRLLGDGMSLWWHCTAADTFGRPCLAKPETSGSVTPEPGPHSLLSIISGGSIIPNNRGGGTFACGADDRPSIQAAPSISSGGLPSRGYASISACRPESRT